jgi:hypothetical protein
MSLGNVLLEIFWFMMLVAWIWLFVVVLGDLFRDPETGGWAKAAWTLFLIAIPWLGCLMYLIFRGKGMSERAGHVARAREEAYRAAYVQPESAWTGGGTASELSRLVELRDRGAITNEDYDLAKARILSPAGGPTPAPPAQRDRTTAVSPG